MGKTKKQKNSKDTVVNRVKQTNTFKPHRKKTRSWKQGKSISGALLENVQERQEQFSSQRRERTVKQQQKKKNQHQKTSKLHSKKGQSAFTVLKQGASNETFENSESVCEKKAEDDGLNGSQPRKKQRRDSSGERVGQRSGGERAGGRGQETASVAVEVLQTENKGESQSSKRKKKHAGKTLKGNKTTGETANLNVAIDKGNKKNKKKTQVDQAKETVAERNRKTSKETSTTDSHFKKKGKKKKMAEKDDPQSVTSSTRSKVSSHQGEESDRQADDGETQEVIDLIDSDSEMSDSNFSVIDLTLNEIESEAVNFEPERDEGGESSSEVKEGQKATNQERGLFDLEPWTVEEGADKASEDGRRRELMESGVGRENEDHRPRVLAACDGQILLVLRNPGEYCFLGRCFLKCLHGNAEVLGYQLTNLFQAFYSPACNSLLTITTKENQFTENEKKTETDSHTKTSSKKSKSKKKQTEILTEQETVEKLYSDWLLIAKDGEKLPRENVTLLLARRMESNVLDYISTFKAFQKLWDSPAALQKTADVNPDDLRLTSVGLTFIPDTRMVSRQHVSQQQLDLFQKWDEILNSDLDPIVIVVGGKNSGKSTLNRYLVNHTLNKLSTVCFLECDIGQTEFTPPGCVSLQTVNSPVLGPPFTHQKVSKYCYYYGGLSGGDNPNLYVECVRKCLQEYRKLADISKTKLPLVVNTMGWIEDLGLEILISLIRIIMPSLLVQINFQNVKMNAEPLTSQFINSRQGWVGYSRYYRSNSLVSLLGKTKHSQVNLMSTTNNARCQYRWKASEFRDLAVISYMSSVLSKDSSLSLETPYGVSWNEVAINICSRGVPRGEWIAAINATVVGLAHADLSQARRHSDDEPYILDSTPVCPCIGFGMVRAIDVQKKVIYITTPLSLADLAEVNTIIRGTSNIPQQIFTEQISKENLEIPYVTRITSSTASKNPRQRKYIPSRARKHLQEGSNPGT